MKELGSFLRVSMLSKQPANLKDRRVEHTLTSSSGLTPWKQASPPRDVANTSTQEGMASMLVIDLIPPIRGMQEGMAPLQTHLHFLRTAVDGDCRWQCPLGPPHVLQPLHPLQPEGGEGGEGT